MISTEKKYTALALVSGLICFLALYIYQHRKGRTGQIDGLLMFFMGGIQSNFSHLSRGVSRIGEEYLLLVNAKRDNENLLKEKDSLQSMLASLKDVEQENQRLVWALDFKAKQVSKTLAARVISHDVAGDYFGIRIDRGEDDGVKPGYGIISPSGVVGRVYRVFAHYSDVMTLADPASSIDAVIQRSRARGVVSGQAKTLTCKLKYMDRLEDVAVNDTVVSTDFGGVFPKGLLIGYVSEVSESSSGILQNVNVRTAVDIYRLEEVLVVFPASQSEKIH